MISEGKKAPGFSLAGRDGTVTTLGELLEGGGGVLVAFYKISCPTCQLAMPYLDRLAGGAGLRVVGISQNNAVETGAFETRFGIGRMRSLIDDESTGFAAANAYGIVYVPSVFVIGAEGAVKRSWSGFSREDLEYAGELAGVKPFEPGEQVPNFKAG